MAAMPLSLESEQVWKVLADQIFGVLGMVTATGEARTAGVNFAVHRRTLCVISTRDTWKVRHMQAHPQVSMTVLIPKHLWIMPWMKIPPATITFRALAQVAPATEADPAALKAILRGMQLEADMLQKSSLITLTPVGEFVTYGVGVSLMQMRDPSKAMGRAPVGAAA